MCGLTRVHLIGSECPVEVITEWLAGQSIRCKAGGDKSRALRFARATRVAPTSKSSSEGRIGIRHSEKPQVIISWGNQSLRKRIFYYWSSRF